jgi:hypothetical protein
MLMLASCSHSDPTGVWPPAPPGPFGNEVPTRLTYALFSDLWPHFSATGDHIAYSYHRGTIDNDRCLGVLPGIGGQRVVSLCVTETGQDGRRDGVNHGALSGTGQLAYTIHTGNLGGFSATEAALWVAPMDSLAGARKVFDLQVIPPGAPRRWDYLLDPQWISDTELAFIGTEVEYIPPAPFQDPDTVYVGRDVATVRLDGNTPVITVLASLLNLDAMVWDASASRFVLWYASGVHTLPATGGTPALFYGLPDADVAQNGVITGVAAAGGKVWISWSRIIVISATVQRHESYISEVRSDGSRTDLNVRIRMTEFGLPFQDEGSWRRLSASPDGSRLVAEGIGGPNGDDLYLLPLP